ncbi:MAG: hypothetical protein II402_00610 [Bacteroidaceae bacterium]|jgi:regulator of replication initiation timing|nr:hypothetical protein [Bacteroidaceae bacterium]MBQ2185209.1 hypothetical protein [Bacteroidaceae bacterium]MBQ6050980.1 hypothetical protein [Bacteroidaceae bacterium]MBR3546205.1 hypothetical protein [Bacteroidaceae bacterium]MBR4527123.1 hypothetical protein [Bacteroidaceae bacterium]
MDAQLMDLVVRFETRTRQLLMQYKQLQQENAALLQKLGKREDEILTLQIENEDLKNQYQRLKTAKYIDLADDDKKQIRGRISKMVRDIDKCIALLKVE